MKVVINRCYGEFGVSEAVYEELGIKWDGLGDLCNKHLGIVSKNCDAYRASPALIAAIEKVGLVAAAGEWANLVVKEIPDNAAWEIEEYGGLESLRQPVAYY